MNSISKLPPTKKRRPTVSIAKHGPGSPNGFVKAAAPKEVSVWVRVGMISGNSPIERMKTEKQGIEGGLIKDMARELRIPAKSLYEMLGVPKATVEKKAENNEMVTGAHGYAALGMMRILGIAKSIVDNSTSQDAKDFDVGKWVGEWIGKPQAALGGRKPSAFLDTPTGIETVCRLLGAIESGAYL